MSYLLGGLMQGLGKGMELTYLQNRETALENLRNQRQLEGEGRAESRQIAKEGREAERAKETAATAQQYKLEQLGVAGDETRRTKAVEFSYDVKLTKIKADEDRTTEGFKAKLDKDLATLKSRLDRDNDEYSQQVKAAIDSGRVKDRVTDTNGRVILVMDDGKMVTTPFTEREKVDTANPYSGKPRQRGPTPDGFDPDSKKTPATKQEESSWYTGGQTKPAAVKTATLADLQDLANKRNMTLAQARKWAQGQGITIK